MHLQKTDPLWTHGRAHAEDLNKQARLFMLCSALSYASRTILQCMPKDISDTLR